MQNFQIEKKKNSPPTAKKFELLQILLPNANANPVFQKYLLALQK